MSRLLVSFDPGLRVAGVAIFDFDTKQLVAAGLPRNPELIERGAVAWRLMADATVSWVVARANLIDHGATEIVEEVVTEYPQVYVASKSKGDPNDLIEITGVAATFLGRLYAPTARSVLPREWKGTIDPEVIISRVIDRLSIEEHKRVELPSAKSLQHNVWDAVGIGLHALGRFAPRKVYPR